MSNEKVKSLVIEFKAEKQKLLDDLLIGSMIASMTEEEFISIGERAASEIKKCFSELDQTTPKCASSEKTNDASTRTPEAIETTSAQNDTFEECSMSELMDESPDCIAFNSGRSSSDKRSNVVGNDSKSSSSMKSMFGNCERASSSISSMAFLISITSLFASIVTLAVMIAGALA